MSQHTPETAVDLQQDRQEKLNPVYIDGMRLLGSALLDTFGVRDESAGATGYIWRRDGVTYAVERFDDHPDLWLSTTGERRGNATYNLTTEEELIDRPSLFLADLNADLHVQTGLMLRHITEAWLGADDSCSISFDDHAGFIYRVKDTEDFGLTTHTLQIDGHTYELRHGRLIQDRYEISSTLGKTADTQLATLLRGLATGTRTAETPPELTASQVYVTPREEYVNNRAESLVGAGVVRPESQIIKRAREKKQEAEDVDNLRATIDWFMYEENIQPYVEVAVNEEEIPVMTYRMVRLRVTLPSADEAEATVDYALGILWEDARGELDSAVVELIELESAGATIKKYLVSPKRHTSLISKVNNQAQSESGHSNHDVHVMLASLMKQLEDAAKKGLVGPLTDDELKLFVDGQLRNGLNWDYSPDYGG